MEQCGVFGSHNALKGLRIQTIIKTEGAFTSSVFYAQNLTSASICK